MSVFVTYAALVGYTIIFGWIFFHCVAKAHLKGIEKGVSLVKEEIHNMSLSIDIMHTNDSSMTETRITSYKGKFTRNDRKCDIISK